MFPPKKLVVTEHFRLHCTTGLWVEVYFGRSSGTIPGYRYRCNNLQWHQPRWQHQCSLKHFPWLCVAQMESPSHGRKSGLPAQLRASACASSSFPLFTPPDAAISPARARARRPRRSQPRFARTHALLRNRSALRALIRVEEKSIQNTGKDSVFSFFFLN